MQRIPTIGRAAIVLGLLMIVYLGCNKSPTSPTNPGAESQAPDVARQQHDAAPPTASVGIGSVAAPAEEGYGEDDTCDPAFSVNGDIAGPDEIKQGKHGEYQVRGMVGQCGTCKGKQCKPAKLDFKWSITSQPENSATVTPQGNGSSAKVVALKAGNASLKVEVVLTCERKGELLCTAKSEPNALAKAININP